MVGLSVGTTRLVDHIFVKSDVEEAVRLLETECADNLPLIHAPNPEGLERIRFAAIRSSGGDLQKLRQMIDLAKLDWRDLLIGAGFGDSIQAHQEWAAELIGSD
jgi:hypothetical protein